MSKMKYKQDTILLVQLLQNIVRSTDGLILDVKIKCIDVFRSMAIFGQICKGRAVHCNLLVFTNCKRRFKAIVRGA